MKKLILGLFLLGLTTQVNSQTIELPETFIAVNYKYVDATSELSAEDAPARVKRLEKEVLKYDNKDLRPLYDDEYETYKVSFFVPEGKIVAAYDKSGKIIRTIEKYTNVKLPMDVMKALSNRFPNWAIVEDVYLVNYHCDKGTKQVYKITLKNQEETVKIKTDENGNFL